MTSTQPTTPADCTCTNDCPETDNCCHYCSTMDIYDPCPVIGFGCGTACDDDEHCAPEQQRAAEGQ